MTCPAIYPRKSVQGLANTGDRKTPAFLTDSEAYGPAPKAAETQRTPSRLQGPQGTGTVNAKRREAGPRPGRLREASGASAPARVEPGAPGGAAERLETRLLPAPRRAESPGAAAGTGRWAQPAVPGRGARTLR